MYSEQRIVDTRGPLEPDVSAWIDHCRYGGECLELAMGRVALDFLRAF